MAIFDEIMEKMPDPAAPAAPPVVPPAAAAPPAPPAESHAPEGEKRIHQYKDQFEKEYPEKK